jgi:hypothetical protein
LTANLSELDDPLASDIATFLDAALVVPEPDIPAAESLRVRMVSTWPEDDDGWNTARRRVADQLAEHYMDRIHDWARAIDLSALYLDSVALDETHPREDAEFRALRRGKEIHRVELDLARAFAEALLQRADVVARIRLLEALDSWDSWPAVVRAMSSLQLKLDPGEALTLASRAIEFAGRDGANDTILDHVKTTLSFCPESVDAILEGWLTAGEAYVNADVHTIGVLALWRLPERPNSTKLRRRLVDRLARLHADRLAPHVAFRSWSKDAPFVERKSLLLTTIERIGDAAVSTALAALAHDPDTTRSDGHKLLGAIVGQAVILDENAAVQLVRVLQWIAEDSNEIDATALVRQLPPPGVFTAQSMHWLDHTLSILARGAPEPVREYVLGWIGTFAAALKSSKSLTHLLRRTRKALPGDTWLIQAAVSNRPALRVGATRCLVGGRGQDERRAGFEALSKRQVHALGLQILSQVIVDADVNLLFELARVRPDCLDVLGPLLGEPTIRTYPGRHQHCVEAWAEAIDGLPEDDPQVKAVASLRALIETRNGAAHARFSVRELLFDRTLPLFEPMAELFTRQVRKEMRAHESPLRAMATKVPIACGEATTMEFGNGDASAPSPMTTQEIPGEGLYLDNYDPVAAILERRDYAAKVEQLLASPNREDSA